MATHTKPLNLRFPAVMLLYGALMFVVYRDAVAGPLLAPLAVLTARMTAAALRLFGIDALREDAFLSHPEGFAYEVAYTCTGFVPALTFTVCLLASSASIKAKCAGIALGIPILLAVNLVRLVHLFYLGVYFPGAFRFAHEVGWEILLAVAVVGSWMIWLRRVRPGSASFAFSIPGRSAPLNRE